MLKLVALAVLLAGCTVGCTSRTGGSASPAAAADLRPANPCVGIPQHEFTRLLGSGWNLDDDSADLCRIASSDTSDIVILVYTPDVSLRDARAKAGGGSRDLTVGGRPAFVTFDGNADITVSRTADTGRPGVLECSVTLAEHSPPEDQEIAVALLTQALSKY